MRCRPSEQYGKMPVDLDIAVSRPKQEGTKMVPKSAFQKEFSAFRRRQSQKLEGQTCLELEHGIPETVFIKWQLRLPEMPNLRLKVANLKAAQVRRPSISSRRSGPHLRCCRSRTSSRHMSPHSFGSSFRLVGSAI